MLLIYQQYDFNLIKFAHHIETDHQLADLFSIYEIYSHLKDKLIIIPLGEKYKQQRITSLHLGSKYMFCYVTDPVVPSQLSYEELI